MPKPGRIFRVRPCVFARLSKPCQQIGTRENKKLRLDQGVVDRDRDRGISVMHIHEGVAKDIV